MNRFNTMLSALCATALVLCLASTAFAAHRGDKSEHFVKNSAAGELSDTANLWEDATGNVRVERRLSVGGGVSAFSLFATEQATAKNLQILDFAFLKGKMKVQGSATLESDLTVQGSTSLESKLTVQGPTQLVGGLEVVSSRRLKYDISGLSGPAALTLLDGLNPVAFKFKGDDSANTHLGFIAEDIPAVLAASDGQGYRPLEIIAVLTKALQVQQTMIRGLQEQFFALKAAADHAERP